MGAPRGAGPAWSRSKRRVREDSGVGGRKKGMEGRSGQDPTALKESGRKGDQL